MNFAVLAFLDEISFAHWLVIVVGSFFLLLQIYCCIRFMLRLRKWRQLLLQLIQKKSGRASEFAERSPWLRWVAERFPEGQPPLGTYSRDEVMNELDDHISADRSYLLLQRLSVMAPLLGVLLTVVGAMTLELKPEDLRQLDIMFARVVPVIAGVGVGALLAFVNQWLLHAAGRYAASLRIIARRWFDAYIWDALGSGTKSTSEQALESIAKVSDTILASADQQAAGAKQVETAALAISQAGEMLKTSGVQLNQQLDGLPQELGELRTATENAVAGLTGFSSKVEGVLSQLDVAVAAFRGAVVDEFCESAKKQNEMLDRMNQSSESLSLASRVLGGECRAFSSTVHDHAASMGEVNNTLKEVLIPAHIAFGDRVGEVNESLSTINPTTKLLADHVASLGEIIDEANTQIQSLGPQINGVVGELSSATSSFKGAVETDFADAAKQHADVQGKFAEGSEILTALIHEQRDLTKQGKPAYDELQKGDGDDHCRR